MRTLLLTDAFLPHAGGSRIYYFNLYTRLVREFGEEVTVITRKSPGWQAFDGGAGKDLRIRRYGHRSNHVRISQWPKLFPYFGHTVQARVRSDIIHTGDLFPAGICGGLLHSLAGTRYVTYCHGEEIPQSEGYRYQPRVRNWIYRNADVLVANSKFTRKKLLKIGMNAAGFRFIPPAVNWERFAG